MGAYTGSDILAMGRYFNGGYLNIGDLILYGKFKNALGRITGFGKNDKGDPTVVIQPVDKEGAPKKGQPKELVMLKVRKVEPEKEANMNIIERVAKRYITAAGIELGKTWENGKVRIHRFSNSFKIWDLTNAGKRGKKVRVMNLMPNTHNQSRNEDWMKDQSRFILLNASNYDSIRRFYEDVLLDFPGEILIDEYVERGIDVLPGSTRKIELKWSIDTTIMILTATPLDFQVISSVMIRGVRQATSYWPVKKDDAKRFYSWLSGEGEGLVKRMDIQALRKLWRDIDVRYDSH